MAVISANRKIGIRSRTTLVGTPPTQERETIREWVVRTDSNTDTDAVILASANIPNMLDPLLDPYDPTQRVVSVEPRQRQNEPTVWDVVVTWRTSPAGTGGGFDEPADPLQRPIDIAFGGVSSVEPVDVDADGNPNTNSAGVTFEDPIVKDVSDSIIRIVRNEASFNQFLAAEYRKAVNSDAFLGWSIGQVRVRDITAVQQREPDFPPYFRVTYEFEARFDGWLVNKLDVGRVELDDNDDPVNIDTADGENVVEPVMLDGNGQKLGPNDPPVFLQFQLYPELPFSVFGF